VKPERRNMCTFPTKPRTRMRSHVRSAGKARVLPYFERRQCSPTAPAPWHAQACGLQATAFAQLVPKEGWDRARARER
jgi:hypothetical protein